MFTIVPIVEGDGEVKSVPILLSRLFAVRELWNLTISKPIINAHGIGNLTKENGFEKFLKVAMKRNPCDSILVVIDADVHCAKELAIAFADRALNHNPHIPTAIVATKYRLENWFLGSSETIQGYRGLNESLPILNNPEAIPDPIRWIENHMRPGRAYRETVDQPALMQLIDLGLVSERSRSFRRLLHAIDELSTCISSGIPQSTPNIAHVRPPPHPQF
jgi:hypothetical protein